MSYLYILGGQQKGEIQEEWRQFQKGKILKVDLENMHVQPCLDYVSPQNVCPEPDPSILFKAGTVEGNRLYTCTQTEVIVYSLPDFKQLHYISLPCFNDLHHVRPSKDGNLLVVSTGLDLVLKINYEGDVLEEWNVLGKDPWVRFSKNIDYRKVPTTKPHEAHPNYVFELNGHVWATRCLQKDVICLTDPSKRIYIGKALIHDGVVVGNFIYFTRVDGTVVIVDARTYRIRAIRDLTKFTNYNKPLGWCRGIQVLNNNKVIIGFSRLRPSNSAGNEGEGRSRAGYGVLPTRVACYDLKKKRLLWQLPLEDYGLNSIFSIHLH
ncbi:hypothetical protein JOD43_001126 [Pullulanibacillus pueri]|uniref:Uncharacterized protein n=1 Tax=Pullulanibacillus pueri TaxID=1437324 RepID=A0A8J2ZVX4_9BACL|nr:hypothetical protein [Pullulanibacillus pueri]MBM7680960.1 hypothetical protein [Pullulanibacillus pueri]GGH81497.1 hypothetical protein GCM10007096_19490 [Pullulanibacillus pueri]